MIKQNPAVAAPAIENWDDVDQALKELGTLDFEIEKKEMVMTATVQRIQERYKPDIEEKTARSESLSEAVRLFCARHKADFAGKQTKELNFGEVKFRVGKPSYIFLNPEPDIADALVRIKKDDCVKIEKKVIKNALKNLTDSVLQKLGIKLVPGPLNWFITPYREKIIPTNDQ